jgi:hypothetical protein
MANALRDHVWFIDTAATLANVPPGEQRWRTIRVIPGAATDDVSIDRIKEDSTFEEIWRHKAIDLSVHESRLDLRSTRGFRVRFTSGTPTLYIYGALDGPMAR